MTIKSDSGSTLVYFKSLWEESDMRIKPKCITMIQKQINIFFKIMIERFYTI